MFNLPIFDWNNLDGLNTTYIEFKSALVSIFYSTTLRKMCPYSELFWSIFSRIQTEYKEMRTLFMQFNNQIK